MSRDVAIRAEALGKRYAMGERSNVSGSLRESGSRFLARLARRTDATRSVARGGEFWALRDVTFELPHGEVLGVVGHNGAGKSTLLKLLTDITEPTEGRIEIAGRVGALLEVGTGFHSELTGRENIFLNGAVLGMTRREVLNRYDEIVEFSGVGPFLDTPVKRYSTGMRLRLGFSVAAHLEPDILIIDEVLAVGDAEFQRRCLAKVGEVTRAGRTAVFVSHNVNAVEHHATVALWLDHGRVVEVSRDVGGTIERYLATTHAGDSAPAAWVASEGDVSHPSLRPRSMYLGDSGGRMLTMPARSDSDMWVYVRFAIESLDPGLKVGYGVVDESGLLVYQTFHSDGPIEGWPAIREGEQTLRGRIPRRVLNEGHYTVHLVAELHGRETLLDAGSSSITVPLAIKGGLSDSPQWVERRAGAIAPALEWEAHVGAALYAVPAP